MKLNPKKKRKKKCCRENNSNKKKCKKRLNEIFLKIHLCVYFVVGSVFSVMKRDYQHFYEFLMFGLSGERLQVGFGTV